MNCKSCGAKLDDVEKSCGYCGSLQTPPKPVERLSSASKGRSNIEEGAVPASPLDSLAKEFRKVVEPEAFYEKPKKSIKPQIYRPQREDSSKALIVVGVVVLILFFISNL